MADQYIPAIVAAVSAQAAQGVTLVAGKWGGFAGFCPITCLLVERGYSPYVCQTAVDRIAEVAKILDIPADWLHNFIFWWDEVNGASSVWGAVSLERALYLLASARDDEFVSTAL